MTTLLESGQRRYSELRLEMKANQRLRWLVYGGALLFLLYLLLVLDDWRLAEQDELAPALGRLVRLEGLADAAASDTFVGLHASEQAYATQMESRLWQAATEGLAGADFQSWVRLTAQEHGLLGTRLDLSQLRPEEGMSKPLWRLEADLSGIGKPADVREFLATIASSEKYVQLERFSYSPRRGNRVGMLLVAWFRLVPDEEREP